MRMETHIRKSLGMKAHWVTEVAETTADGLPNPSRVSATIAVEQAPASEVSGGVLNASTEGGAGWIVSICTAGLSPVAVVAVSEGAPAVMSLK